VVTSYGGTNYVNGYGDVWPGTHQTVAYYVTPSGANYEVDLAPADVVASSTPSAVWQGAMQCEWDGWTLDFANAAPEGLQLTVKTYSAYASGWQTMAGTDTGQVGAMIDIATNFTPGANQKSRWIQVVTTNSVQSPQGWQIVDPPVTFVDTTNAPENATEPYYMPPDFNQRGFTDRPRRTDITDPIVWQGEVFFVLETAPMTATVYPEGVTYGWEVHGRDLAALLHPLTIAGSGNPNPTTVDAATTLTATLTIPDSCGAAPTGQVTFVDASDNNKVLGVAPLLVSGLNVYSATLSGVEFGSAGGHNIVVSYSGDSRWSGINSTFTETVNKRGTGLDLQSSANPALVGQSVTLTAYVSPSNPQSDDPTPTGIVIIMDGSATLGTATLNNGTASITTSSLAFGSHSITATYNGDDVFDSSTSSLTQVVTYPVPTLDPIDPKSVNEGSTLTLTASASGADGDTLTFSVDPLPSNSGATVSIDSTTGQLSFTGQDGPAVYTINVHVTDLANQTVSQSFTVSVGNVAPTAQLIDLTSFARVNSPVNVQFINQQDPSQPDTQAGFTYYWDYNGDGDFNDSGEGPTTSASATFTFTTSGQHTIHARIMDKDGGFTDYWLTITIGGGP